MTANSPGRRLLTRTKFFSQRAFGSQLPSSRKIVAASLTCVVAGSLIAISPPLTRFSAAVVSVDRPARATSNIKDKIYSTAGQLAVASKQITKAKISLDAAAAKIPTAQARLDQALNRHDAAVSATRTARASAAAARLEVGKQNKRIAKKRAQIQVIEAEIASLSRAAYIAGGDVQEIELLLSSTSPTDYAIQVQSVKRQARGNSSALDRMAAARVALAAKLIELKRLEDLAAAQSQAALVHEREASDAAAAARSARSEVAVLVAARHAAVSKANTNRARVKAIYSSLLAEQARIERAAERARRAALKREKARLARERRQNGGNKSGGSSGEFAAPVVDWAGRSAAAREAAKFALAQLGSDYASGGGTGPAYDCIGLMWRAWHVAGSKMTLMQVEDLASSKYVESISESQARAGDFVYWRLDNGTDSRPGARDHIGMVIDGPSGLFIEAGSSRTGVNMSNWKEDSFYMNPVGFGRVIR